MRTARAVIGLVLLTTSALIAADNPQYVISTYAGGAPLLPLAAIALAADSHGAVYFVDGYGYTQGVAPSNSVFRIDSSGSITRIAGNSRTAFSGDGGPGASASLNSPVAVAVDRIGNVFIVDAGNQRVRQVSLDGTIMTVAGGGSAVLGDGGPALGGQLNYPSSIAVDNAGNLFIGELGRVRRVAPSGIITTVAGGGPNNPENGGLAVGVQLSNAIGLAVDAVGNLFIADQNFDDDGFSYTIRAVSPSGNIATLARVPYCCSGSLAVDAAGNLFVPAGPSIWKISPAGVQSVAAGNGIYGAPSGDGRPATLAQLNGPTAVAVDPSGNLFIADNVGRTVRNVTPDGIIHTLASIPSLASPPSGDGGLAVNAQLQLALAGLANQSGLATDAAGNLYIAETGAHRVRKVSPDGTITSLAGIGGPRCSSASNCLPLGDGDLAVKTALSYPIGVAVDGVGNVFIADSGNARVRKVSPDGIISTVAGNGTPMWYPIDGGLAINTPVIPYGVAVDAAGNLFISEGNIADIRKVTPDGIISTAYSEYGFISAATVDRAGNLYVGGSKCNPDDSCYISIERVSPSGNVSPVARGVSGISLQPGAGVGDGGSALSAQLGFITSLSADAAGNLFVADIFSQRIRKIDGSGIITTVGGDGIHGYSGDNGPATSASLNSPFGLATDSGGNIYVSDFNQSVRILRPSSH